MKTYKKFIREDRDWRALAKLSPDAKDLLATAVMKYARQNGLILKAGSAGDVTAENVDGIPFDAAEDCFKDYFKASLKNTEASMEPDAQELMKLFKVK